MNIENGRMDWRTVKADASHEARGRQVDDILTAATIVICQGQYPAR